MMSFVIKAILFNEQQIKDFEMITHRLEQEQKMKVFDLCYWLKGRNIEFQLSYKYNKDKSIKWNISKYRNFIRLKVRIREELS